MMSKDMSHTGMMQVCLPLLGCEAVIMLLTFVMEGIGMRPMMLW